LGLGEGPRFVLFEPYHLCHLEVAVSIAKVVLFNQEIINNRVQKTKTIAVAKKTLRPGDVLGGIGSDDIYGNIANIMKAEDFLPVGVACGNVVINTIHQDQPIKMSDVHIPNNAATRLLGLKNSSP
jgi:predicted homoserine dehydrogenase-like protein